MSHTLQDHLTGPGPKRILSLDGGGVRGLITLGLLSQVESPLAARYPDPNPSSVGLLRPDCGTSTGAIIATMLAFGKRVGLSPALFRVLSAGVFAAQLAILSASGATVQRL